MGQNGCAITSTSEAPFVMSQLLSKLDASDNIEFGREMLRMGKEENVFNLINWLNKEASLRSRIKRDTTIIAITQENTVLTTTLTTVDSQDKCPRYLSSLKSKD